MTVAGMTGAGEMGVVTPPRGASLSQVDGFGYDGREKTRVTDYICLEIGYNPSDTRLISTGADCVD